MIIHGTITALHGTDTDTDRVRIDIDPTTSRARPLPRISQTISVETLPKWPALDWLTRKTVWLGHRKLSDLCGTRVQVELDDDGTIRAIEFAGES